MNRLLKTTSTPVSANNASLPQSFGYQYNDANQRMRVTLGDGSYWVYEYDKLGQVKSGKRYWSDNTPVAGQQVEYTFDDIGNRTTAKAGGDNTGNSSALRSWIYTVDALNRYSQRIVPNSFDVIGQADFASTVTVNSGAAYRKGEYYQKSISVANSSSAVYQTDYSQGAAVTYFYAYDANGNVEGLVNNADGSWGARYEYDPFGNIIRMTGLVASRNPFRFSSKYTDDETGFVYYGYRFYTPSTGRWLSRDPIGERAESNLYGMVGNNPVQFVDALGLRPIPFSFNAFINGNRRGYWHDEPGAFGLGIRQFGADDRDFGEFDSSQRNARVFSIGTIESKLIGAASRGGASGSSNTGDSHRRVRRFPSVSDIIGFGHGADTAWDYETKQAGVSGGNADVVDLGPCKTKVTFTTSAAYPFVPFGIDQLRHVVPNINYSVTFTFEVTSKNQVTVTLTGSHNSFPDYEGYADENNFYKYSSSWSGPNPINLGVTWHNIPSGTKHVINNIQVAPCCPSSNK